jgi:predicted Mrr-cat superfamily restriction endonuclease
LWVIRPEPNFINRLNAFLDSAMVAIGWPAVGSLAGGLSRNDMAERLAKTYEHYLSDRKSDLPVAAGVLDRFVNQIHEGDIIIVPDQEDIYLCRVQGPYEYHSELSENTPEGGYPHWHRVSYMNHGKPICKIKDLPLGVRRSIDCRLTVFSIHSAADTMWDFLRSHRYVHFRDEPKARAV